MKTAEYTRQKLSNNDTGGNKASSRAERLAKCWLLIISDIKKSAGRVWPVWAVMTLIYIGYWAVILMTGKTAPPVDRVPVLYLISMFFSFSVPAAAYGYINDSSDGACYAMLPLPARTKFGVMMLVAVVLVPLGFYLSTHLIDCVLTLVGNGKGFAGLIWENGGTDLRTFWSDFGKICLYQSVFILGNIALRKHKTAMTVLAMLAIHGVFIGMFQIDELNSGILYVLYSFVAPACIWAVSYLLFKRLQFS